MINQLGSRVESGCIHREKEEEGHAETDPAYQALSYACLHGAITFPIVQLQHLLLSTERSNRPYTPNHVINNLACF